MVKTIQSLIEDMRVAAKGFAKRPANRASVDDHMIASRLLTEFAATLEEYCEWQPMETAPRADNIWEGAWIEIDRGLPDPESMWDSRPKAIWHSEVNDFVFPCEDSDCIHYPEEAIELVLNGDFFLVGETAKSWRRL